MSAKNVKTLRAAHQTGTSATSRRNPQQRCEPHLHRPRSPPDAKHRNSSESGLKDGPRHFRTAALAIPSTLTQETLSSPNSLPKHQRRPIRVMKPTGRKMSLPFCEICHFDKQGRIVSGGCYYDNTRC